MMSRKQANTKPLTAAEYKQHRIEEVEGQLRLHHYYRCRNFPLPDNITSPEFSIIAERAIQREEEWLKSRGIKRLAPGEGPQMKRSV